jgi:hypothetical protein
VCTGFSWFRTRTGTQVRSAQLVQSVDYGPDSMCFETQQHQKMFLFSETSRPDLGVYPTSYPMKTAVLSRGVTLATRVHLVFRSRMSGAIPVLSLYAFMAWTRKTSPVLQLPVADFCEKGTELSNYIQRHEFLNQTINC